MLLEGMMILGLFGQRFEFSPLSATVTDSESEPISAQN